MVNGKSKLGNQSGFTFMEIVIGIAVIGLFFAFVVPLLTDSRDGATVTVEIGQMRATLDRIDNRYFAEPITDALDNEQVITGRLLSSSYRTTGDDTIYNQFGGAIEINGINENGLTWSTTEIPTPVCLEFAQEAQGLGFLEAVVNGTAIQYSQTTVAELTTACQAGTEDTVDMVFTRPQTGA